MHAKVLKFILVIVFTILTLNAQTGKVSGVIKDAKTGDPLPGANIVIGKENPIGAASNLDGEYIISGVPAGTHILTVTYIGYRKTEKEINVEANELTIADVELSHESIRGEDVIVTAQSKGQLQAINQQISSDKIVNIVSEAKIQELPDFNAAQAIGRLPGVSTLKSSGEANKVVIRGLAPEYNSIQVEGIKLSSTGSSQIGVSSLENTAGEINTDRSVDLTMVTPYMIKSISVYKSLTPDMNANSIGGTVDMELRKAPSKPHYNLMWQSGYTAKSNTYGNYRAIVSGSNRFFNDNLGVYALINAESYDRNDDNMSAQYNTVSTKTSPNGFPPVTVRNVRLTRHIENRKRFGGNLILDYSLPSGSIKAINMFTRLESDYQDYNQQLNYSGAGSGNLGFSYEEGENMIDQQVNSLRLDYDLGFLSLDMKAAYTSSKNKLPRSPRLNFNQTGGIKTSDVEQNIAPDELSHLVNYYGDTTAVLRSISLFSSEYEEDKYTYQANFKMPFNFKSGINGFIKFGGQMDKQTNINDQSTPYCDMSTGDQNSMQTEMMDSISSKFGIEYNDNGLFPCSEFTSSKDDLYDPFLDNRFGEFYYATNPTIPNKIINYLDGNEKFAGQAGVDPGGWFDGPYQRLANDYEYKEDYYAGYIMSEVNFLNFKLVGGMRYEKVESEYFAYNARDRRSPKKQVMYPITVNPKNEYWLPMGQIKYDPFDWVDIRYAYTQSLARPDYHELSPKHTVTQSNQIYTGNPDLKPAEAFNHDLIFSFHNDKLGLLTIGAFYKTIKNFTYSTVYELNEYTKKAGLDSISRFEPGPDPSSRITLHKYINSPYDATVQGIEVEFQTNFWYLPFPFNGIVFGINYSHMKSETRYPWIDMVSDYTVRPPSITVIDSSRSGRLIHQPNDILNSHIGYDYKGFSTRLSFIFQGNSVSNVGRFAQQDGFTKDYFRIDLSARQKLPWAGSELFMDVTNLNDENNVSVQRSIDGFTNVQHYGLTANLGIRFRF